MADASPTEPIRLQIRKYPNRRYYDATRSQHVTLEQIHSLIRQGYEVQVIDSKTEQDITAKVLAQIIIELDPPKLGVFSVPMLHRLLQSNEELVGEFINRYLNQPLMAFLDSQRSMEEYFRSAFGMKQPVAGPSDWARAIWGPFNPAFWGGKQRGNSPAKKEPWSAGEAPSPEAASDGRSQRSNADQATTRELLAQIEALREEVSRLHSKPASGKARGRKKKKLG